MMMLLCLIQKPALVAGFLFYAQDVRYAQSNRLARGAGSAAGAWMRMSGDVQDVRGIFYE